MTLIDPKLISAVQQNYAKFYRTLQSVDSLYMASQENFNALRKWCESQGITLEVLGAPGAEHVFSSAFVACKAAGLLQFKPNDKQLAEIRRKKAVELERRDREAGSRSHNRIEETPTEAFTRLKHEKDLAESAEKKAAEEKLAAEKAAIAAENDLTIVPSAKELIENGFLSPRQQSKRFSLVQQRLYCRREREAQDILKQRAREPANE